MKAFFKVPVRTASALVLLSFLSANGQAAEQPALDPDLINQADIESGAVTLKQIRRAGLLVYSTPFNRLDGYGDGPLNAGDSDKTSPGNRPSLQNAATPFLRINGLDAQTCLECHSILSRRSVPMTFAVGGHGGTNNVAMAGTTTLDMNDSEGNGFAHDDGRTINPPFMFGAGGVELLGKEMSRELQEIRHQAQANSDAGVVADHRLITKGVDFGSIRANGDGRITLNIAGGLSIDQDLVVRPFGRKGEFFSVRDFDRGAMMFHLGMQPSEVVGPGIDGDDDGVADEVTPGEMSALSVFLTSMPTPRQQKARGGAREGQDLFDAVGCAGCHIPEIQTDSRRLSQSFPDVAAHPSDNVYLSFDLSEAPARFQKAPGGGIRVRLFADLKRHDMGPGLAESTGGELDPYFTTARLWGIADSAPYLHDGRALTLREAILAHGGEAQAVRDAFAALTAADQDRLLAFLDTLRVPRAGQIRAITR